MTLRLWPKSDLVITETGGSRIAKACYAETLFQDERGYALAMRGM
jgi:hypothetical protein